MAAFKDLLEQDYSAVFNSDEFGEMHSIDDKDIAIVIDNDLLKERKIKSAEGTYIGDLLFFVKKSDFGDQPAIGQVIKFDTKPMRVSDFQEDMGVYTITLEANMS